jgi:hypothetical protein
LTWIKERECDPALEIMRCAFLAKKAQLCFFRTGQTKATKQVVFFFPIAANVAKLPKLLRKP